MELKTFAMMSTMMALASESRCNALKFKLLRSPNIIDELGFTSISIAWLKASSDSLYLPDEYYAMPLSSIASVSFNPNPLALLYASWDSESSPSA